MYLFFLLETSGWPNWMLWWPIYDLRGPLWESLCLIIWEFILSFTHTLKSVQWWKVFSDVFCFVLFISASIIFYKYENSNFFPTLSGLWPGQTFPNCLSIKTKCDQESLVLGKNKALGLFGWLCRPIQEEELPITWHNGFMSKKQKWAHEPICPFWCAGTPTPTIPSGALSRQPLTKRAPVVLSLSTEPGTVCSTDSCCCLVKQESNSGEFDYKRTQECELVVHYNVEAS